MNALAPLMSSADPTWCTPQEVVDLVLDKFGPIWLDPCSNPASIVPAAITYDEKIDGLVQSWGAGLRHVTPPRDPALVYINPPYGRALPAWIDRAIVESRRGLRVVTLLPARVDTRWFAALRRAGFWFWFREGRLRFLGAPAGAPFPSVLAMSPNIERVTPPPKWFEL